MTPDSDSGIISAIRDHETHDQARHTEIKGILAGAEKQTGEVLEAIRAGTTAQIRMADLAEERAKRDAEDRARVAAAEAQSAGWWRSQWERWGPIGVLILVAVLAPQILPQVLHALVPVPVVAPVQP